MPKKVYKSRVQITRNTRTEREEDSRQEISEKENSEALADDLDDILAEVDEILEANAEVLENFKQVGGE